MHWFVWGFILAVFSAMITHVGNCIMYKEWVLLILGVIVPPIGLIHGVMVWFGLA